MKKLLSVILTLVLLFSAFSEGMVIALAEVAYEVTYTEGYYEFTLESDANGVTHATIVGCDDTIVGNVTVPTHLGGQFRVKHIASVAFEGCDLIESLTIGGYIESIGAAAFSGCENIRHITLPSTPLDIGYNAFIDTAYYKNSKNWENDVLYIGTNLIKAKDSITGSYQVKAGTTSIACFAFEDCSGLTNVVVPDSTLAIGRSVFDGCDSLQSMTLPFVGSSLNPLGDEIFESENFAYIFGSNSPLFNNAYVPESLKKVVITKDTNIADQAFLDCRYIESITLPNTVKSIGEMAFYDCWALKSITIPSSVKSIGVYAFRNCWALDTLNIKNGLTTIGEGAFYNCVALTEINLPNSVTSIGESAFRYCENIKKMIVPFVGSDINNTESLDYLFSYSGPVSTLKEVVLTKATVIGSHTFSGWECIESITIPSTVKKIEDYAFYNCTGLKKVNISDLEAWCNIDFAGYDDDNPLYYAKNLYINGKLATNITIPASVKNISAYAFSNCTSLQNVIIQNGTLSLGFGAFRGCANLKTITLPTSLNDILYSVFDGCNNLKSVFYCGTESQKNSKNFNIEYNASGEPFANAKWYYKSCNGKANHTYTNACDTSCNVCKETRTITHAYKTTTTKATLSKNGSVVKKCTVCGKVASNTAIRYAKTFTLSATSYTYDGKVKKPTVTVKDSAGKTISSSNYTVTYSSGRKNAGTYTVKVTMKGNYSGTKTLSFKIKPINISKCSVKLSATSYTYNGKAKTPSVVVKNANGTTLMKNTHYTVTYESGRKKVGTYKVTIKGKGNYTGTKTLTFKINPSKTTVSKLTAGKKSIAVAIAKKSTQVTGYQIQYSTLKTFNKATTKTISSYKTTKYTLKSLSSKKTYYVRVRTYKTVNGTRYYSGWSAYKQVKTK